MKKHFFLSIPLLIACCLTIGCGQTETTTSLSEPFSLYIKTSGVMGIYETTINSDLQIHHICGRPLSDKFEKSALVSKDDYDWLKHLVAEANLIQLDSLGDSECQVADAGSISITVISGELSNKLYLGIYDPSFCNVADGVPTIKSFVNELEEKYLGDEATGICPTVEIL
jgi:hypothetical protein